MFNPLAEDLDSANNTTNELNFCPLCQVPLQHLKISASSHVAGCSVVWDNLSECPDGETCFARSIFHYRDYAHYKLANYRSSSSYISPYREDLDKCNADTTKKKSVVKLRKSAPSLGEPRTHNSNGVKRLKRKSCEVSTSNKDNQNRKCKTSKQLQNINIDIHDDDVFKSNSKHSKLESTELNVCDENYTETLMDRIKDNSDCIYKENINKSLCETLDNRYSNITISNLSDDDACTSNDKFTTTGLNNDNSCDNKSLTQILENCSKINNDSKSNGASTFTFVPKSKRCDNTVFCKRESNETFRSYSCNNDFVNSSVINNVSSHESSAYSVSTNSTVVVDSDIGSNSYLVHNEYKDLKKSPDVNENQESISNVDNGLLESSCVNKEQLQTFLKKFRKSEVVKSSNSKMNNLSVDANSRVELQDRATKVAKELQKHGDIEAKESEKQHYFKGKKNMKSSAKIVKSCPFYKKITDTSIVVDAFNYGFIPGITAYFLSHFHSDHYVGLKKSFAQPIFCSKITADLIKLRIGVNETWINVMECGEPRVVNGVEVVALDANHCPGSVMFLFRLRNGQNYLHVGDFRASPEMELYQQLRNTQIHKLYLDTTYCKPNYDFPTQKDVIEKLVNALRDVLEENPKTLIMCGTYVIGKEKVFSAVAEAYNFKIWADRDKMKVLNCINDKHILNRLTDNPLKAQIHVTSMFNIAFDKLETYLQQYSHTFTHIIGLRPTGWSQSRKSQLLPRIYGNMSIYEIPYSEHSSFSELRRFVQFIRPDEIIPTVNVANSTARAEMNSYFKSWRDELRAKQTTLLDFIKLKKTLND